MKVINDKKIEYDYYDNEKEQKLIENIEFNNCKLQIYFMRADSPNDRTLIRNIKLNNCEIVQFMYAREIFENITINNLKTNGVIGCNASVFKHVVLKGKIGDLVILNKLPIGIDERVIKTYLDANEQFYKSIDWALDISEAEFIECSIRGIPTSLIKRDPETQVIITKNKIIDGKWKKLKFKSKITRINIEDAMDFDDFLIIAPKRASYFDDKMEDIYMLRKEGLIE